MAHQNKDQVIDAAEVELMRRLRRIEEVEEERDHLAERVDALEAMLADADEKREYWRAEYVAFAERVRMEGAMD